MTATKRRPWNKRVVVEAMGFTWRLPWRTVKADVESGFAILMEG